MLKRLDTRQLKLIGGILAGLILIAGLIIWQQNLLFGTKNPPSEQESQQKGENITNIQLEMTKPRGLEEINFEFQSLSALEFPELQMENFQSLLFELFPYVNHYRIQGDVSFITTQDGERVLKFTLLVLDKAYQTELRYLDYNLVSILKDGDQTVYNSLAN